MRISSLFSDNMVLQRNKSTLLSGFSYAQSEVLITFDNLTHTVISDEEGLFECPLSEHKAGGPYDIEIVCKDDKAVIRNVLFGDVYLLGGQSNMELTIGMIPDKNKEDLETANNSDIRMFQVERVYDFSGKPKFLENGEWKSVSTDTIADFSCIGYYFAKEKFENDGIPVGLVQTALGGAPIEALMSEENLLMQAKIIRETRKIEGTCDRNKSMGCIFCYEELLEKVKSPGFVKVTEAADIERVDKWHKSLDAKDPGIQGNWMKEEFLLEEEKISVPGFFMGGKYEKHIGTLWLQKRVEIPKEWLDKKVRLSLGTLVDFDTTYVNGIRVGSTDYKYPQRRYDFPGEILKEGENFITVRLGMDNNVGGLLPDMPYEIICENDRIDLTGEWIVRKGATAEKLGDNTFFVWNPTALFNSMLAPLKGMAFDSIFFYQGESNCGRPEYYDVLFKAMINEWRSLFGHLPFYYAELACYFGDGPVYERDVYIEMREVQRTCEKEIEDAYLIPNSEPYQYNELHPQNKKEVAHRFYEKYMENNKINTTRR